MWTKLRVINLRVIKHDIRYPDFLGRESNCSYTTIFIRVPTQIVIHPSLKSKDKTQD